MLSLVASPQWPRPFRLIIKWLLRSLISKFTRVWTWIYKQGRVNTAAAQWKPKQHFLVRIKTYCNILTRVYLFMTTGRNQQSCIHTVKLTWAGCSLLSLLLWRGSKRERESNFYIKLKQTGKHHWFHLDSLDSVCLYVFLCRFCSFLLQSRDEAQWVTGENSFMFQGSLCDKLPTGLVSCSPNTLIEYLIQKGENLPVRYPALGQRSATGATPDNFIPLLASLSQRRSDQCSAQQGHQVGWHQQGVKVHRGYSWDELGCVRPRRSNTYQIILRCELRPLTRGQPCRVGAINAVTV